MLGRLLFCHSYSFFYSLHVFTRITRSSLQKLLMFLQSETKLSLVELEIELFKGKQERQEAIVLPLALSFARVVVCLSSDGVWSQC